jgi:hypothetical protein
MKPLPPAGAAFIHETSVAVFSSSKGGKTNGNIPACELLGGVLVAGAAKTGTVSRKMKPRRRRKFMKKIEEKCFDKNGGHYNTDEIRQIKVHPQRDAGPETEYQKRT